MELTRELTCELERIDTPATAIAVPASELGREHSARDLPLSAIHAEPLVQMTTGVGAAALSGK